MRPLRGFGVIPGPGELKNERNTTLSHEGYIASGRVRESRRGLRGFLASAPVAAALVIVCFLALSERAEASFPGEDGRIVFGRTDSGLYTIGPDEERARKLTGGLSPAYHASGERIAYSTGGYLYETDTSGDPGTQRALSEQDADATWRDTALSASGEVFASARISGRSGASAVFKVSPGGKEQVSPGSVAGCRNFSASNPAVSPATGDLAFEGSCLTPDGGAGNESRDLDVYVGGVSLTGGSDANDYSPSYSPDGERIAFVSDRDGNAEIYVMDADGRNVVRLTHTAADEDDPVFSPSGKRLAFIRDASGANTGPHVRWSGDLYVMDADGAGETERRLTSSEASEDDPDWGVATSYTPVEHANLEVSHPRPEREPKVGERFDYEVLVENPGNVPASGVVANIELPDNVSLVAAAGCKSAGPTALRCPVGTLAAGDEIRLGISVRAVREGRAHYTARITSELREADLGDNESVLKSFNVEATPPRITRTTPANRTVGVSPAVQIAAYLSEPIRTPAPGTVTLVRKDTGKPVAVEVRRAYGPERLIVVPKQKLVPGKSYTVKVRGGEGGITDVRGNPMSETKSWSFTVRK
ncbi:conserved repeat domain [Rubrobacter radiotolerans]|uniref:Conserved repeat domain n=1 Tax=Rubrobacter radiotolerans TaxID=42256 RepID=A0A023WZ40_RUBRA|nr:conserved repeat domain [Rubrobacter radiotolerans]